MKTGKFNILYDAGHGSSGKGAVSARLVQLFNVQNCSTNNYPNAGHTVRFGERKFVAKILPSPAALNIVGLGTPNLWIGPGSGFFEQQLKDELVLTGYAASNRVNIHERAVVVSDQHVKLESPGSDWSTEHLASTMSGSGAAYARKAMRQKDVRFASSVFDSGYGNTGYIKSPQDFAFGIRSALQSGQTFLHEVSQGYALSLDYGTHKMYCTFRNCTPQQACADMMILPSDVGDIYMNVRSFPIRVGNVITSGIQTGYSGDFCEDQIEITWDQLAKDAEMPDGMAEKLKLELEKTTVTKRTRRVATQSWSLLAQSAKLCGATKVVLNFPQYIHWSAHRISGGEAEFRNMHPKVRAYVDKLEEATNLKVVMICTGADHNDFVWRD